MDFRIMLERDGILLDAYVNDSPGSQISLVRSDEHNLRINKANYNLPIDDIIKKFSSRHLTSEDVVYFCKSSITPRYKVKSYCENNGLTLNKTNRINHADTFVINKADLEEIRKLQFNPYFAIPFDLYKNDIKINLKNNSKLKIENYKWFYVSLKHSANHQRRLGSAVWGTLKTENVSFVEPKWVSLMEIMDIYVKNPDKYNIVFDQTISSKINEYILDPPTFRSLEDMLMSKDTNSWKLAAEILSNCDREKYKIEILLLLNKYYNNISQFRQENLNLRLCIDYFKNYELSDNWQRFLIKLLKEEKSKITAETRESLNMYALHMVQTIFAAIEDLRIESVVTTIN